VSLGKKLFILLMIELCSLLFSPVLAIEDDLGLWTPIYLKAPITEKVKVNFEVNPRIQENVTHINQLLIRPSVGYQLNKHWSIWQGYAWVTNYIPHFVSEQRIWEQVLYEKESKKFSRFSFSNRLRLEERFIQKVHGTPVRIRNMFRFQYALDKDKKWSAILYDEPFINLSTHHGGPQSGVDQNRLFIGLNHKFSSYISAEGGYLMQYLNIHAPRQDRINHNILLSLYFSLPQIIKSKE